MRFMALHDREGTIVALTSSAPDAPAVSSPPGPGQQLTEIDVPDGTLDIATLETEERVIEALREFRIEVQTDAKLVRRTNEQTR